MLEIVASSVCRWPLARCAAAGAARALGTWRDFVEGAVFQNTARRTLHVDANNLHHAVLPSPSPWRHAIAATALPRPRALAAFVARRGLCDSTSGTVVSFPLAQTGEGISECELMQWFVKEGDAVEEFQPLCEVQSDKASIEITSKYAGTVVCLHHEAHAVVKVGAPLVDIAVAGDLDPTDTVAAPAPPDATAPAAASVDAAEGGATAAVLASPAVRRVARELGVDLSSVVGSGGQGRVMREDVERHASGALTTPAPAPEAAPACAGAPAVLEAAPAPSWGADTSAAEPAAGAPLPPLRLPIRGYRRAMVRSSDAAGAVPMFHFFDEVRVDALLAARAALRDAPELAGARLTLLPFAVKALSVALGRFPGVGAHLEAGGEALLQARSHNIGVAMATPEGLVVPNIKQVESKGIVTIAQELAQLQQLAAAGRLEVTHVTGGTLTISNIGTIGGTNATPLVNPPESAIVALGRVRAVPAFADDGSDRVVRRNIMHISFGADHRVVDGATIAQFSGYWKQLLEEPISLLLHLR